MASLVWSTQPVQVVISSRIVPQTVAPGGILRVEREIKRTRPDCGRGTLHVSLVDSNRLVRTLEPIDAPGGAGLVKDGVIGSTWPIPETMPVGASTYRSWLSVPCFPFFGLWPLRQDLPDITFYVQNVTPQREATPLR